MDTVRDGDGAVFSVTTDAGDGDIALSLDGEPITSPHRVGSADLWSPASPRLHLLEADLYRGGVLVDRYVLRCGIRTLDVAGDKLLLNGAPVRLRGFARHEDFPVLGRGVSPALAARDLHLMRQLGANSFRTAHYPCDEETLDLADQLGLMVIAETPAVALYFGDENDQRRQELSLTFLAEMIARDRNRASVISWSVANEPRMNHPRRPRRCTNCATRRARWTGPVRSVMRRTFPTNRESRPPTSFSSTAIPGGTRIQGNLTSPSPCSPPGSIACTIAIASPS